MTDLKLNPEAAVRVARELLHETTERRVNAVRALVDATNTVDSAEQGVKDARDAHTRAWTDAITSGWSDKELRATGARPPQKTAVASRVRLSNQSGTASSDVAVQ